MKEICFIGLGGYSVFMSVDHFNMVGETVSADSFYAEPGGKGYNQAVAAARLGGCCSFVGAFGADDAAKLCLDYLAEEGIQGIPIYKNSSSAYACILTDKSGENRVTVYGGAASELSGEDIYAIEDKIKTASAIVLQNEVSLSANRAACDIAEKHGVMLIINPAPAVNYDIKLLQKAFVITPNEHEAKAIFGTDWENGMKRAGIKRAVVTMGANGCAVYENGEVAYIPAAKAQAVDTTGAGDCFTGALCVKILEGDTLTDAAKFATKAAALSVGRRFAVKAMPRLEEIQ